jgi:hypothetical protein
VSNRRTWEITLSGVLLVTACSWGQATSGDKQEEAAIQRAKNQLASSFDRALPKVTLEFFLKYESGGAPITWEVNDCGEQTGNAATDQGRDFPMCVEADFDKDHAAVSIMVSVGTFKKGPSGVPKVFSVTVVDSSGLSRRVRHLGDLPKELHRPMPKSPRDRPDVIGDPPDLSKPTAFSE